MSDLGHIHISSYGSTCCIQCPPTLTAPLLEHKFLHEYIPDIFIDEKVTEFCDVKSKILLKLAKAQSVDVDGESICISYTNGDLSRGNLYIETVTVVEYLLESLRQKEGIYTLHGSALDYSGAGVAIIGSASGIGKTTLSLALSKQPKFQLIADDKFQINSAIILGGLKTIRSNTSNSDVGAVEESIEFVSQKEKPTLAVFIQPVIVPTATEVIVDEWSREKAEWHLYEELSRNIRGISRTIFNRTRALQSMDTTLVSAARLEAVKQIAKKARFYTLYGSKDSVVSETVNMLKDWPA